jgi:hypothetical protein
MGTSWGRATVAADSAHAGVFPPDGSGAGVRLPRLDRASGAALIAASDRERRAGRDPRDRARRSPLGLRPRRPAKQHKTLRVEKADLSVDPLRAAHRFDSLGLDGVGHAFAPRVDLLLAPRAGEGRPRPRIR